MIRLVGPCFRRLCLRIVIISGSALPTNEIARNSNGEKLANLIWRFRIFYGWMKATSNQIKDLLQWKYFIVDSPVKIKNRKNAFLMMAPLESGNSYIPINRIQNGECKRTVIRNLGR
jgi:hypothetical protein